MSHASRSSRRRGPGADFGFLPSPPRLQRIVARAHVCCALQLRAGLDAHPDRADAALLLGTVQTWLARSGAEAELEAPERAVLAAGLGALDLAARERAGWLGEAAVLFAWALRRGSLPRPGAPVDASAVAESLGFLSPDPTPLHTRARLRPRVALLAALELIELVEARLRQALSAAGAVSLASWRGPSYSWPEDVAVLEFVGDDLAIDAQPLAALPAPRLFSAWRASHERRRAAAWLLGAAPEYSQVADGPSG